MGNTKIDYVQILQQEIKAATGCTEPIAVAYAAALAKKYAGKGEITKIDLLCSGNIIKNAMGVRIPGTAECGVCIAAALGAIAGDPDQKLEVLDTISPSDVDTAKQLCKDRIFLITNPGGPKLYINVTIYTADGQYGKAIIQGTHDCIAYLEHNGKMIMESYPVPHDKSDISPMGTINDVYQFVGSVAIDHLDIIARAVTLNTAISKAGLQAGNGYQVGQLLTGMDSRENMFLYAIALTAAGSDARMAGVPMPVMSNSGSGNQGICATVPVAAIAEQSNASYEEMLRACTLSNLIAIYAKQSFGRLSPLCGAVAAAIGSSAGMVYLLGGGLEEIKSSIQNMLGSVMGMICDGAKSGCAMKVSACTFAAVQAALVALSGKCISSREGIIEKSAEESLENIGIISEKGMAAMDSLLLKIMTQKEK